MAIEAVKIIIGISVVEDICKIISGNNISLKTNIFHNITSWKTCTSSRPQKNILRKMWYKIGIILYKNTNRMTSYTRMQREL